MGKLGQSSFRRILLSRILLLSVPILLVGEYVTYKKARSALLETARQNLIESAVRKGERIEELIAALKSNLMAASQSAVLKSNSSIQSNQKFISELATQLPTRIQCIQLSNFQTGQVIAGTCGDRPIISLPPNLWTKNQTELLPDLSNVYVTTQVSKKAINNVNTPSNTNQLKLILSAPVYNSAGQLQNVLTVQSIINQQQRDLSGSLYGNTVVIDQDGTILEHPQKERQGKNISQQRDASRLEAILRNAINGQQYFLHLSDFQDEGVESVVGYSAIPSPLSKEKNRKWVILAVANIDSALYRLEEIKQVLLMLTLGLIAAILLATLYLSRDLARPLEQLGDYALNVGKDRSTVKITPTFKISELNQLSESLDSMVGRLTIWAEELENAWKEAQTANKLKTEFLANTSHELRTPLNAIIGCIRLVRDGCCDDREEELDLLQKADDAAIHLLHIINDILDLSKIESGTLSVVMRPVDVRSILKEVIDLQMVHINQKGLQLLFTVPEQPIIVQADPAKLKQVFLNVIGNAVKFTEKGSITITTTLESIPSKQTNNNNYWVLVKVKDTGIGIPVEEQKKLFRPFVMADGTRTRKYGGTGLGLAISRKIMALMEGTINLHSPGVDLGTTLEISMPIVSSGFFTTGTESSTDNKAEVPSVSER
ncbi:ATP-binding protein [Floridanema aerugineum]|jgi:signal transduction histidine kinase|uniref:histidine kinase n=1 Tax=Floridaenema aerugineum BLCC-F46 TaxID=3153654 RepID=A0ABV4WZP7_9CYAN